MKNQMRANKYEPTVQEVELIEANPNYAHVKLGDERETTVSIRYLAPSRLSSAFRNCRYFAGFHVNGAIGSLRARSFLHSHTGHERSKIDALLATLPLQALGLAMFGAPISGESCSLFELSFIYLLVNNSNLSIACSLS
ncbi:hypothetical protein TNIN_43631 [Trichonephila inaurata madagascariensis]|uniref:Uncharacterized protein n=1 Tax=Trichonephila inaurata madagascariensis TaxID=2747483 RepID=A0A8X7C8M1_9ARAC|nr:hypothetical protein TNIN_43631 [Trichonephila inaurata madagascariensis]